MLINITNHPKDNWTKNQTEIAEKTYGKIYELPFPNILPELTTLEIIQLAKKYAEKVKQILSENISKNNAVHVMGEFCFVYHLVRILKDNQIDVVASVSERIVVNEKNGIKTSKFDFYGFREY